MQANIMKRGLSPEGQRFRKQQQGSLQNSEQGVCSAVVSTQYSRKPPKDFIIENIEQLRIKSGSRMSSAQSVRTPVKSLHSERSFLDCTKDTDENKRFGSAHSDYFSLSDENLKADYPVDEIALMAPKLDIDTLECPNSAKCSLTVSPVPSEKQLTSPVFCNEISQQTLQSSMDLYSILSAIKEQKPTCEAYIGQIWNTLSKQHKLILSGKIMKRLDPDDTKKSEFKEIKNSPQSIKIQQEPRTCSRADSATQTMSEFPPNPPYFNSKQRDLTFNKRCSSFDTLCVPQNDQFPDGTTDCSASMKKATSQKDIRKPFKIDSKKPGNQSAINRTQSVGNLEQKLDTPPSHSFGKVPKYLLARKARLQKEEEAAAAIDPNCPPGHNLLPETERINTLDLLFKGQERLISQISRLPLAQDTLRLRQQRKDLESKLKHIEEGIQIFSQSKVYILNDE